MSSSSPHYVPSNQEGRTYPKNENNEIIIKPKDFSIVWGNDPRYWQVHKEESKPAELLQVSWLEVTCSASVEAGKKYAISFKISLRQDAFGWNGCPVFMMAKIGKKGKYSWKKIKSLDQYDREVTTEIPEDKFDIQVPNESADKQLYFGLYEVWSGKWKGGLTIHEAIIRESV